VLELLRALADARGASMATVERLRDRKRERRGGFDDGVVLERVREGAAPEEGDGDAESGAESGSESVTESDAESESNGG